jgi:hypothetical protein
MRAEEAALLRKALLTPTLPFLLPSLCALGVFVVNPLHVAANGN